MFQKQRYFKPSETQIDQQKLELTATSARARLQLNEAFFAQALPALHVQIKSLGKPRFRTFYTRFDNLNLFDTERGSMLYDEQPKDQSQASIESFLQRPLVETVEKKAAGTEDLLPDYTIAGNNTGRAFKVSTDILPQHVCVVMGLGLGYSLEHLIAATRAKAVILYEKNLDMLLASMEVIDWQKIFEQATARNVALFIQAGKTGDSLNDDLTELAQAMSYQAVIYYRHYPDIDYDRAVLSRIGVALSPSHSYKVPFQACLDVVPASEGVAAKGREETERQWQTSLKLLQTHKPHIADFLKSVKNKRWLPYINQYGRLNAFDTLTGWALYSDTTDYKQKESAVDDPKPFVGTYLSAANAESNARTNYRYHQMTAQFYRDTVERLSPPVSDKPSAAGTKDSSIKRNNTELNCPGLLINGIGLGYEVTALLSKHKTPHAKFGLLLESDEELLALSLSASAWLERLAESFALAEDFTLLLDDPNSGYKSSLPMVFYTQHGASVGASMYLDVHGSEQSKLAINALLEAHQQLFFAANYDDNLYHINHAAANLANQAKVLSKRVQDRKTPILLVGNGPSLDENMLWIKRNRDKAIVVSCGTSLYTLHKAGILPDFHAEIEIVRFVAEMKNSIPADDMKQISLLATVSTHPDLIKQFADAYLVTRQGLEVTDYLQKLGAVPGQVIDTRDAAPTCVNLAASVFIEAGYHNLIFCGVDLAAHEDGQHHASNSYYDDENYNIGHGFKDKSQLNERSFVEGFDGSRMASKSEFIFAIQSLERALARFPTVQAVNLSRGAKLHGTQWADDSCYQLANASLDKQSFKHRLAKGFRTIDKPANLYSADKVRVLIEGFAERFNALDEEVQQQGLGVFDYFAKFRQLVRGVKEDPANLLLFLFYRSSKFYESMVLAFAVRLMQRHGADISPDEAFNEAFQYAYGPWQTFCSVAIDDLRAAPLHLENSSLEGNKVIVTSGD